MGTREWMQQFLSAKKSLYFLLPIGIAGAGLGILLLVNAEDDRLLLAMGLCFSALGAYAACKVCSGGFSIKNWIRLMEREGKLEAVLIDFRDAADYLDGELRLGNCWCFGRGYGIPTPYGDILRVYQQAPKANFTGDSCLLMAVTTSGMTKVLCKLPLGGKGDQAFNHALTFMLSQNPTIQIRYR